MVAHFVKGVAGNRPEDVEPVNEVLSAQGGKGVRDARGRESDPLER